MSKICLTGDLHFHNYKDSYILEEDVFNAFRQVTDYCFQNRIKELFILGDIFHVRGKIPVVTFNMVYDELEYLTQKGLQIKIISGNHDQVWNQDNKTSSIYSLGQIDGVEIVNFKGLIRDSCNIQCVPYLNTQREFTEALKTCKEHISLDKKNILFTHGVIKGAYISSGYSFSKSTGVESGLDIFDMIFAGHIHIGQKLFNNRAIVTGSPLCHSKKDMNSDQRGFWVLDTETLYLQMIPTEYKKFTHCLIKSRQELESILFNWNKRDFLFLTINTTDIDSNDKLVKEYANEKIEWDFVKPPKTTEIRLAVEMGTSEEKIIEKFIDIKCDGFDKDLLTKMANELLEEYDLMEKK